MADSGDKNANLELANAAQPASSVGTEIATTPVRPAGSTPGERGIRSWLERNRIFFDTIAASLLSVMAITVAVVQILIADAQTDLTRIQTRVAQEQVQPQFDVVESSYVDETTNQRVETSIEVRNYGGLARSVSASAFAFLEVTFSSAIPTRTVRLCLDGYYDSTFHTNHGTGLALTIQGYRNAERYGEVYFPALEKRLLLERQQYLILRYTDVLGHEHVEYFHVPGVGGVVPLPLSEGKAVAAEFQSLHESGRALVLQKITVPKLASLFNGGMSAGE